MYALTKNLQKQETNMGNHEKHFGDQGDSAKALKIKGT